jgi:hypothetical protein
VEVWEWVVAAVGGAGETGEFDNIMWETDGDEWVLEGAAVFFQ